MFKVPNWDLFELESDLHVLQEHLDFVEEQMRFQAEKSKLELEKRLDKFNYDPTDEFDSAMRWDEVKMHGNGLRKACLVEFQRRRVAENGSRETKCLGQEQRIPFVVRLMVFEEVLEGRSADRLLLNHASRAASHLP